ncbi:MAG: HpaII family restriction endonuclease [Candidatus Nomurabacteria bacterium]|jgi:type II restriction enzyme|nr:HpaII family restriction endonuclease [Candidatus Nomurabacteria bacterium]
MPRTYNKGEWGELYTAVKILNDRKIPVADIRLNSRNEFINVLRLFLLSVYGEAAYDITEPRIALFIDGKLKKQLSLNPADTKTLLSEIQNGSGHSFSIPIADKIMSDLELDAVKANATIKADIVMEADIPYVNDSGAFFRSGAKKQGFTIKSMIGAKPTLLNTSQATNFVFKLDNFSGDAEEINEIDGTAKIMKRVEVVRNNGGKFVYSDMADETFKQNLRLIDYNLPEIVAQLLFVYYTTSGKSDLPSLVKQVLPLLSFGTTEKEVEYKIKEFICAIALGMMPTTLWDGKEINGGCIIAKNDGDLVCFTLLDKDAFKDYLYRNIKFDSPSSSRHNYGSIYEKYGEQFMNLNIQLRFL